MGGTTAEPERSILLRPDPETGAFAVEVLPPFEGIGHDRTFPVYRQARGYAGGLRMCLGLPVVDRCEEEGR